MRATEIIRSLLDQLDDIDSKESDIDPDITAYTDNDIKRFRQIQDLVDSDDKAYSNTPRTQYSDLDSVTVDAGADSWQGTKDPADIRGEHPSLYPGRVHGAK